MELEPGDRQMGVHFITSDDLEDFAMRLGEAVAEWSLNGVPSIAFSHAATEDGFNYVGIVTGLGTGGTKVEMRPVEDG